MGKKHRKFVVHEIAHTCPVCKAEMECLSSIFGRNDKPTPGTYLLCIRCTEIGMLLEKGETRKATPMELFALMMDKQWRKVEMAQALIKAGSRLPTVMTMMSNSGRF